MLHAAVEVATIFKRTATLKANDTMLEIRSYSSKINTHFHSYAQWVLPLKGSLHLKIADKTEIITANTGALIAPYQDHSFLSQDENLFIIVDMPTKGIRFTNFLQDSFFNLPRSIRDYLHFAKSYLSQHNDLAAKELIADFLIKLLKREFSTKNDLIVLKAQCWINNNVARPVSIKTVASHCCLSVSQLQRRFKHITGQTIADYWRARRLFVAEELMLCNGVTIEQVAAEVGYENLSAFSRSFARVYGYSPRVWRNMHLSVK